MGLGELLEILFAVEGTLGDEAGRAIGRLPRANGRADDLAKVVCVTAIATEGFHQHRNAGLVLDNQVEHDLVEIRADGPGCSHA